jgi:DNA (cytosine-5)-methyltransferase 1
MKRDLMTMALDLGHELIIDNFAGGGGTSTGLEAAFGRPVDIAINHDPEALAMHAINHPHTKHLCESVWDVDPIKVTNNQPVGLVWLSPDCKHFSKAKGGKPVEKKIRGLAWVTLRWAAKCKPRVIMLENVEEFRTWGPLKRVVVDGVDVWMPDPAKKGKTFESFARQLEGHGYKVEFRELRASDHATPTIRKRLFMVARRDGLPIRWPTATHGAPDSPSVRAGRLQPHRTAAECIDWSLPCPSIFDRKRPLAEATLRRIAKGIMRYVVDAADPFIVTNTTGHPGAPVAAPLRTVATGGHHALVSPTLVQVGYGEREGQAPRALDIEKPLGTVVAGSAKAALVTAFLNEHANASNQRVMPADAPLRTICAQVKGGHFSMVSAALVGVGGRAGDSRPRGADEPTATSTAKADTALVTAFMAQHNKERTGVKAGRPVDAPISTLTASGSQQSVVVAHIQREMGKSVGHAARAPLGTVTAGGGGKSAMVASSLVKLRGTSTAAGANEPLHTISAGGQHHAEVRSFLLAYYGTDQDQAPNSPLATITSRDRFGLVTIQGQDYEIVDIGLRMLAPHELYRAQGFPADYIIDEIPDPARLFVDGHQVEGDPLALPRIPLTKSAQVRMCGNSVCPPLSEALIRANFAHEHEIVGRAA